MNPKNLSKLPVAFGIIAMYLVFLLIPVVGVEILLAFLAPSERRHSPDRAIRLREHNTSRSRFLVPDQHYIKKTEGLIQKEYRLETDIHGYISPSLIHENSDINILFLGGSTTECKYISEENRFPYLVGRMLEKDISKKINSINSGVSGNHSLHSIDILLNKSLPLNPTLALMMHNINDLTILLYEKSYWNEHPKRSLVVTNTKDGKWTYHFKKMLKSLFPNIARRIKTLKKTYFNKRSEWDEFAHIRGKALTINKQAILERFKKNLLAFISIARSYGVHPILMTQANRFKEHPDPIILEHWELEKDLGITFSQYRDIYLAMNELIRDVGRSNNVHVIDLAREVPQEKSHMYDVVHLNEHGSKFVAQLIARRLKDLLPQLTS